MLSPASCGARVAWTHIPHRETEGHGVHLPTLQTIARDVRLVITCERLIHNDEIRRAPSRTLIPHFLVDAVCEVPCGAYPGNMVGEYFSDESHLKQWLESEKEPADFKAFLDKYIYGVEDFEGYLELCGGIKRINQLRADEHMIDLRTPRSECHA